MFERIRRGWSIAEDSWAVLKRHPRLQLFPVFSGVALAAVIGALGFAARSTYARQVADNPQADDPMVYVFLYVFALACTFVIIFFEGALICCVLQCFAGKDPSVRTGLAFAIGRLPQILAWTFIETTVGVILTALHSFLRNKLGVLGDLLEGLVEFAWDVATYFVMPVLVVEGVGPIEAIKRSSSIMRRTWGEAITGEGGLGIISFVLLLPVAVPVAAVWLTVGLNSATIWPLAAIIVPYVLVLAVVFAALGTIFRAGLYVYATTGEAPREMDPDLLQMAFSEKMPSNESA
jgi:hypothetical protein